MSHENTPASTPDDVNLERPYLMPRSNGNYDVAHVKVDEQGSPIRDENDWLTLVSQVDGGEKQAHPKAFTDEVQDYFADELAESRPGITPEQRERYAAVTSEMAEVALETVGVEDPADDEPEPETEPKTESAVEELLQNPSWKDVATISEQLMRRTKMIIQQLDEFDHLLAVINREGGRMENGASRLNQAVESLRGIVFSGGLSDELHSRSRALYAKAEETSHDLRRGEQPDEEDVFRARKIEESTEELMSATRIVDGHYDELRTKLGQYGRFQSNVEELIRTTQGYEYTISMLRSDIATMSDDLHNAHGRLSRVEATLEDVDRLRTA